MGNITKEELLKVINVLLETRHKELTQVIIFLNLLCKKMNIESDDLWKESNKIFLENYEKIKKDSKQIGDLQKQIEAIFDKE